MQRRGKKVDHSKYNEKILQFSQLCSSFQNDWEPELRDLEINRQRIQERLQK
jgi:hypothetical protein